MSEVSTPHSGSLSPPPRAIASAPMAATVTRMPSPSSTLRETSQAPIRLSNPIIRLYSTYQRSHRGTAYQNDNQVCIRQREFLERAARKLCCFGLQAPQSNQNSADDASRIAAKRLR